MALSFVIKMGYQWAYVPFASPLIFSAAKGSSHARALNSQAKCRLAFFWLLFSAALGWAATMAPVTVVDVMVLYTPQARARAGGATVLNAEIDLAVAEANLVFENSRANVRVRLVHRGEIDYEESGTITTDLARLRTPNDGFLDFVPALREQHAADLVCVVTETGSDFGFYGLQGPSAANAFSVIRWSYLTGDYFFPVVLSFNFGCQLERPYADSVGAFPFSFGYTARTDSGWVSSIDAFDGTRLPYFSSPDIVLGGTNDIPSFRLGVPDGVPGAANNTKTLNLTAPIVAAFRGPAIVTLPPSVQFISPPGSNTSSIGLIEGTNLTLMVTASDTDGLIRRVDFFQSNKSGLPLRLIGTANGSPFTFVWTNIPAGNHFVIAQAVDDSGATTRTLPLGITVAALPPPNDDFANRTLLSGVGIALTNFNSSATAEPDEPDHNGPPQRSIWWSWTAPASGRATLTSDSGHYFDVYVGAELTALTSVTSGLDSFSFETSAGTAYAISADGAPGLVTMRLVFSTVQLTGLTDGSSIPAGRDVPLSVVTTDNDGVITRVELFVDGVLFGMRTNAPYDFLWTSPTQGFHGLVARAVASDGFVRESPALHVNVTPPVAPNDNLTNRTIIEGTHASVAGSNYGASKEPDEPTVGGSSVWFTWTAPGAGNLRLQAEAEFYFAYIELFTGETLTNLSHVVASVFRLQPVELRVTPGTAYQIALEESFGDQFGDYQLALDFEPEPANDHFTNRIPVSGVMVSFGGSNAGASREPEEPLHTMTTGGKSLWWSWVAPGSGMATITVTGNYPLLAIYSGAKLSNLTLQADNQGPPNFTPILFHEVRFRVTTGTAYSIALDTWGGVPEAVELGILFEAAPPNDDFVHRIERSGPHVLATAPTKLSLATSEPGEPLTGSGNTVWWTWTPPTNGTVTLTADWLVMGVYTGDLVSNLTEVVSPTGEPTHIFRVTGGTVYQIAAGGRDGGGDCPAGCDFRLDFEPTQIAITQPADGSVFYTNETSLEASVEPSFGSVQCVDYFIVGQGYIGSATNAPYTLPFIGVFEATYNLYARAISTDGRITLSDPITVSFRYPRPANDDFADRAILTGSNIAVIASNGGATTEPGEPAHAGTAPNHSLWWSWTAPARRPPSQAPLSVPLSNPASQTHWAAQSGGRGRRQLRAKPTSSQLAVRTLHPSPCSWAIPSQR